MEQQNEKTPSRCVSNNELLHSECLCCLCQMIYISILIQKGLTSMYEYMCRNWKGRNGAYHRMQEYGE